MIRRFSFFIVLEKGQAAWRWPGRGKYIGSAREMDRNESKESHRNHIAMRSLWLQRHDSYSLFALLLLFGFRGLGKG